MQQKRSWYIVVAVVALLAITTFGIARAVAQLGAQASAKSTPISTGTRAPTKPPKPTATPKPLLPALSVQGTQIIDANGHPVTLLGAARSSLEYSCTGDGHFMLADFQAMRAWGMNTVRIPLSSEFWSNAGGDCAGYKATVTSAVFNAESAGLYVILDLQWDAPSDTATDRAQGGAQCPMPDSGKDVTFWEDMATIYGHDQNVLFDLFGEPHDVSFSTWYTGGQVTNGCFVIHADGSSSTEPANYSTMGMKNLVGLLRNFTSPSKNIIIISGLLWGYDFSGITSEAIASFASFHNIIFGTHPWHHPDSSSQTGYYPPYEPPAWNVKFGDLAAQAPVIATEFGQYDCHTDYIGQAINYFAAHHMSWLAWSWNISGCGNGSSGLIQDWSGTPTAPYGVYIKNEMLAAADANG